MCALALLMEMGPHKDRENYGQSFSLSLCGPISISRANAHLDYRLPLDAWCPEFFFFFFTIVFLPEPGAAERERLGAKAPTPLPHFFLQCCFWLDQRLSKLHKSCIYQNLAPTPTFKRTPRPLRVVSQFPLAFLQWCVLKDSLSTKMLCTPLFMFSFSLQ